MLNRNSWRLSLAASLLLCPAWANAQDNDVIVVTGSRTPILADDATATISLLDAADIEARGGVFLADTLRAVPGLAVSRSGNLGGLTQIRARGSEANHILVLIDGVEVASPFTGEADFAHMAFDDIGRIEIARGEQSALWGADAIGGVVHMTTRTPEDGVSIGARLEAGSFETRRGSIQIAQGLERGHWSFQYGGFETAGIDISGLGGDDDGYRNRNAALSGRWQMGDQLALSASLRWIGHIAASDADVDFDGRLDDTDSVRRGDQVFARFGVNATTGVIAHEAGVQLTDDAANSLTDGVRTDRSLGQRQQVYYQTSTEWGGGQIGHRLTGLIEIERDRTKNDGGPGSFANQTRRLETTAFAADYGFERGGLDLTASARHEQNDWFDDATTWRLGAGWAFDVIGGRARASIGEGVKNPGVFELFGFFPAFFIGNPDLQPEHSKGWELGWDQVIADGRGQVSIVYYRSTLEDEIYTDFGVFPFTARNATSESTRSGVELEAQWQIADALSARGSVSVLESEQDGVAEIRRPERLASVTLDWRPEGSDWSGSATIDYTGEQDDTDFGTFASIVLDAYTLVGGQVRWQANDHVEIYARGENLLDEDYQDVFGFHTPGRGVYLGLRFTGGE
jgi:vitamin B12 transporter